MNILNSFSEFAKQQIDTAHFSSPTICCFLSAEEHEPDLNIHKKKHTFLAQLTKLCFEFWKSNLNSKTCIQNKKAQTFKGKEKIQKEHHPLIRTENGKSLIPSYRRTLLFRRRNSPGPGIGCDFQLLPRKKSKRKRSNTNPLQTWTDKDSGMASPILLQLCFIQLYFLVLLFLFLRVFFLFQSFGDKFQMFES